MLSARSPRASDQLPAAARSAAFSATALEPRGTCCCPPPPPPLPAAAPSAGTDHSAPLGPALRGREIFQTRGGGRVIKALWSRPWLATLSRLLPLALRAWLPAPRVALLIRLYLSSHRDFSTGNCFSLLPYEEGGGTLSDGSKEHKVSLCILLDLPGYLYLTETAASAIPRQPPVF